jgi:Golgi nucleoside diphosphatase
MSLLHKCHLYTCNIKVTHQLDVNINPNENEELTAYVEYNYNTQHTRKKLLSWLYDNELFFKEGKYKLIKCGGLDMKH